MFTGIIESIGTIRDMQPKGGDMRLTIATGKLDMSDVALGDSIAVNGVCLTAIAFDGSSFSADVSRETLSLTSLGNSESWLQSESGKGTYPANPSRRAFGQRACRWSGRNY